MSQDVTMSHMLWDLFEKGDNHFMWDHFSLVYQSEGERIKSLQRTINEVVHGLSEPEDLATIFGEIR